MADLRSYPNVKALSIGTWQDCLLFSSERLIPAIEACVGDGLAVVVVARLTGEASNPVLIEFDPLPHTYVDPRTLQKWLPFARATAEKIRDHFQEHPPSIDGSYIFIAETFEERRSLIDLVDEARLKAVRPPRSIGMQLLLLALLLPGAFGLCALLLPLVDIGKQTTVLTRGLSSLVMFTFAAGIAWFFGRDAWENRRQELGVFLFIGGMIALVVGYGVKALIG